MRIFPKARRYFAIEGLNIVLFVRRSCFQGINDVLLCFNKNIFDD